MKLRDMSRKADKSGEGNGKLKATACPDLSEEKYPYGLNLHLETEEIEKLGMKPGDVRVGDKVRIEAEAHVENVSMSERMEGGKEASMRLQIVRLGVQRKAADADEEFADGFKEASRER